MERIGLVLMIFIIWLTILNPVYSQPTVTSYVRVNDQLVAKIRDDGKINYYHNDFILNVRAMTDQRGEILWIEDYFPFGKYLFGSPEEMKFKGNVLDKATGFYRLGKDQFYNPETGRYIIPIVAPLAGNIYLPQSFNKYAYMMNNPYRQIAIKSIKPISKLVDETPQTVKAQANVRSITTSIPEFYTPDMPKIPPLVPFIFKKEIKEPVKKPPVKETPVKLEWKPDWGDKIERLEPPKLSKVVELHFHEEKASTILQAATIAKDEIRLAIAPLLKELESGRMKIFITDKDGKVFNIEIRPARYIKEGKVLYRVSVEKVIKNIGEGKVIREMYYSDQESILDFLVDKTDKFITVVVEVSENLQELHIVPVREWGK